MKYDEKSYAAEFIKTIGVEGTISQIFQQLDPLTISDLFDLIFESEYFDPPDAPGHKHPNYQRELEKVKAQALLEDTQSLNIQDRRLTTRLGMDQFEIEKGISPIGLLSTKDYILLSDFVVYGVEGLNNKIWK